MEPYLAHPVARYRAQVGLKQDSDLSVCLLRAPLLLTTYVCMCIYDNSKEARNLRGEGGI